MNQTPTQEENTQMLKTAEKEKVEYDSGEMLEHLNDAGSGDSKKGRYLSNPDYRQKFLQTVWLAWSFTFLGWVFGQSGPSFLDIVYLTNTDIEKGSAYNTAGFVGFLIGALLSGFLFDRFNRHFLLFTVIFLCAVVVAIIPWCFLYEAMIAAQTLVGLFRGALDAMGNAQLLVVWGSENGPYMQAIHFTFGIGGIMSPLITAPFLMPRSDEDKMAVNTSYDKYIADDINKVFKETYKSTLHITNASMTFGNTTEHKTSQKSQLYIAYFITSALGISSAIPFLLLCIKTRHKQKKKSDDKSNTNFNYRKITKCMKLLALSNMMGILGVFGVVEGTVVQYLSTFCVTYLGWSKANSSLIVSIYWILFALGRFCGIFLIKFINYVKIITSFCGFLIADVAVLLVCAIYMFDIGIWICAPLTGFGLSIMFPVVFTWTEAELFPVTGKISSLFLIGASSLRIVNPLLLGYLMREETPMYFSYLLLGYSVVLLLLCISAMLVSKKINRGLEGHTYKDREIVIPPNTDKDFELN
ncbi:hypothetical protein KUTeg_008692 [Tegillarca granosa]|uniref:Uncharacterized protein n=1 Tax=Tegillarca granosa TaxID=220873 RepID=A0ABQ9FBZ2_TEGGR|nr:hypothetical protein KUTeg_008692 [Tegillarca granosa]